MIDERSFDLCRYYGEDRSVFIDGKREKGIYIYLFMLLIPSIKQVITKR